MTQPKKQGGLGFKDFHMFNQALLDRQAWRILEYPSSLCARLLKAKYFPNGQFLDTVFSGNPSPTWQAITHGLELLKKKAWYGGLALANKFGYGGIVGSRTNLEVD